MLPFLFKVIYFVFNIIQNFLAYFNIFPKSVHRNNIILLFGFITKWLDDWRVIFHFSKYLFIFLVLLFQSSMLWLKNWVLLIAFMLLEFSFGFLISSLSFRCLFIVFFLDFFFVFNKTFIVSNTLLKSFYG